jgi:SAM-dependent methyltransferase
MNPSVFRTAEESHAHSLATLAALYEYDDFMQSIGYMVDMGCGAGLDLTWWATRTTRDDSQQPLNIKCFGIDRHPELPVAHQHKNIYYQPQDFEIEPIQTHKQRFDLVWCHDSFQFVLDPFRTLRQWRDAMNPDGMLVIIVPQTTNMEHNQLAFDQRDFCYHNWTMVSLIHVLAISGFDCCGGYFLKQPDDVWLHAVVYRSEHGPQDPRITRWYDLCELGLLPVSARESVRRFGYLRQRDLVLPWLDRSISSYHDH